MATKHDLQDWIIEALTASGGAARLLDVSRYVWREHEAELRASGDLFYTWQYDLRWAATKLRHTSRLKPAREPGTYELA